LGNLADSCRIAMRLKLMAFETFLKSLLGEGCG
jgi:hypothetical protein